MEQFKKSIDFLIQSVAINPSKEPFPKDYRTQKRQKEPDNIFATIKNTENGMVAKK